MFFQFPLFKPPIFFSFLKIALRGEEEIALTHKLNNKPRQQRKNNPIL